MKYVAEKKQKKVSEIIEEVCGEICDNYCKWPFLSSTEDELMNEHCDKCPLVNKL